MLGHHAAFIISCALGASALLLPAGVSTTPGDKDVALPFAGFDPKSATLQLPCPTCAYNMGEDDLSIRYDLLLRFSVSKDSEMLLLNDKPIYPYSQLSAFLDDEAAIEQIPSGTSLEEIESGDYDGILMAITTMAVDASQPKQITPYGDEIISFTWQVLDLGERAIDVDPVYVQLLRTSEGELLILSIDIAPEFALDRISTPFPIMGSIGLDMERSKPKNCKHLPAALCDMVAAVESKVNSLSGSRPFGCAGGKSGKDQGTHLPTHIRPHFGQPEGKHGHDGPHHEDHDEHHRGPHRHHGPHRHGFLHSASKRILAVLITAMAGVTVGMVVSILGLLTGRFIGYLWFNVIRGGKRGYARVASNDIVITVTDMDRKDESVDNYEALPRYEDAPAYEETEKEVQ